MEYIIITILLFALELIYFKIADKYNIIDKPNHRSSHTQITLRGGGIIFPIAFVLFLVKNSIQNIDDISAITQIPVIGIVGIKVNESNLSVFERQIIYNNKTTNMDLVKLLKVNGKLHAEDLWKMSKHYDDKNIGDSIDKFYSDLKTKIEIEKTIKEVTNEKGYIELV